MPKGGSKPGERRGGRQKGTPNKLTRAAREVYEEAFEKLGGVPALVKWAKDNLSDFYKLHARLIPTDVNAKIGLDADAAELLREARQRVANAR